MGRRRRSVTYPNGHSRSMNAMEAEEYGFFPFDRAVKQVYKEYHCRGRITQKAIGAFLNENWEGEWHHVGPYLKETAYFRTRLTRADLRKLILKSRQTKAARKHDGSSGVTEHLSRAQRRRSPAH